MHIVWFSIFPTIIFNNNKYHNDEYELVCEYENGKSICFNSSNYVFIRAFLAHSQPFFVAFFWFDLQSLVTLFMRMRRSIYRYRGHPIYLLGNLYWSQWSLTWVVPCYRQPRTSQHCWYCHLESGRGKGSCLLVFPLKVMHNPNSRATFFHRVLLLHLWFRYLLYGLVWHLDNFWILFDRFESGEGAVKVVVDGMDLVWWADELLVYTFSVVA
jgi:hypothetical protein